MTPKMRRSLHKWLELYAHDLNGAGYTQDATLPKMRLQLSWTKDSLKDIFRQIGFAMFGAESTEDLDSSQMLEVQREFEQVVINATDGNIFVPWPKDEVPLDAYEREVS
jgi:hypothetical protein